MTDVLDPPLEEALATPDHEIVTLENLRAVSQGRSRGLGVTVLVFALIELLYFGFRTDHAAETTIQFASDTATVVPALSSAMRVVVALLGAGCITVGVVLLVRHRMRALAVLALVVGAGLVAWVLALLLHFNSQGALKTLTVPVSGTAWLIGAVSLVGGAYLVVSRPSRPAYPIFFSATALFILAFLVWIARGSNVGTVPPLELTGILGLSFISATPLIYGSLSGVMCERAGVVNIAIEGQFMFGAMSGAIVASVIGGTTLGLVAGTAVAGAFGGPPRLRSRLHGPALPSQPDHRRRRHRRVLHRDGAVHDGPGPQQQAVPQHRRRRAPDRHPGTVEDPLLRPDLLRPDLLRLPRRRARRARQLRAVPHAHGACASGRSARSRRRRRPSGSAWCASATAW